MYASLPTVIVYYLTRRNKRNACTVFYYGDEWKLNRKVAALSSLSSYIPTSISIHKRLKVS